jgi:RNA polymerase-binding transcription factor DksA
MSHRLSKILINCYECDSSVTIDYEDLVCELADSDKLDLANINTLLDIFKCEQCGEKNFKLLDANDELLFDMERNILCQVCDLAIPFPRISSQPNTRVCVSCKDSMQSDEKKGTVFPSVPADIRGKCPRCEKHDYTGIVVVYRNSKDRTYFLGCSIFPKCHWADDSHFEELNQ